MALNDRWLIAVTAAALLVRLAFVVAWGALWTPDLWEYEVVADNVLAGRGFLYWSHSGGDHWSHVEPLYPLLTAAVYALTGHSHVVMALVNTVLSTLLVPAAWLVGRELGGPIAARGAAVLTAMDPGLVRYAGKFHPLVLDALALTIVVALVLRMRHGLRRDLHVWLGVAIGLCVLTRPTVLAFVPWAAGWLLFASAGQRRRRAALLGLTLAVAALVVSPWVVRNYAVHGRFVLTRTNGPYVFWLGNNPSWTGTSMTTDGASLFEVLPDGLRARVMAAGELEQNDILRAEALRYVVADPPAFVGRTLWRFARFWLVPVHGGVLYAEEPLIVYRLFYWAALIAAGFGGWFLTRDRSPDERAAVALVATCLVSVSLAQSAFYVETRHRLAIEGILLAVSGVGVAVATASLTTAVRTYARVWR